MEDDIGGQRTGSLQRCKLERSVGARRVCRQSQTLSRHAWITVGLARGGTVDQYLHARVVARSAIVVLPLNGELLREDPSSATCVWVAYSDANEVHSIRWDGCTEMCSPCRSRSGYSMLLSCRLHPPGYRTLAVVVAGCPRSRPRSLGAT